MKRKYLIYIFVISVMSLLCSMVDVAVIDVLKDIIDMKSSIKELLLTALFIVFIGMLANYLVVKLTETFGALVLKNLRKECFEHIMQISPLELKKQNQGDLIEKMSSDIESISTYMKNYFSNCILVPLMVLVFGVYLIALYPLLAIICFVLLAVLVPLSVKLLKPIKLSQHEYVKLLGLTNNNIKEVFDGAYEVKAYNLSKRLKEKYYRDLKVTLDISNKNDLRQYNIAPISVLIREAPVAIALCLGGYMAYKGNISLGVVVAFISGLNKINDPLEQVYQLVVRTHLASVSYKRINSILQIPIENDEGKITDFNKNSECVIRLENVDFSYGENEVLKDFSLQVKHGEKLALIGRSGCGKSTVLKLICGQIVADKGNVYMYDIDYTNCAIGSIRDEISLISQDAIIFPMSIADNIRLGKIDASMEEIIDAAIKAGAHTFIRNMKNGYDTVLEENGANLSGGQKQRISIARAILKNSDILLLDEPTSALDEETQKHIVQTIEEISKDKTVITIAHRLSTIEGYDKVIDMDKGGGL
ncbi:MAG: ABC transporter ATP-binding protein [Lachnospiraceae bacterium]|nr:ABC transporter ATP-binding protein [Lachnospiraceae bacterium]